jgi:hypothetical protein
MTVSIQCFEHPLNITTPSCGPGSNIQRVYASARAPYSRNYVAGRQQFGPVLRCRTQPVLQASNSDMDMVLDANIDSWTMGSLPNLDIVGLAL